MTRHTEAPITTQRGPETTQRGPDETITTHPAFGQISVSRVTGGAYLYGSDFQHQHYMTITIRRSELHRNLSRDWEFGREELISVALSEAQWASFVSSPNVGSGVCCTIEHIDGQSVPMLPRPEATHKQFQEEINAHMQNIQSQLRDLALSIDGPINKTKASELKKQMDLIAGRLTKSTGFVAKQFDEHVEHTVERAKMEINAYATNMVMRTGIEALSKERPAITYNDGGEPQRSTNSESK